MQLLDQLPCPTLVTDEGGQILCANTELLTLTGRSLSSCVDAPMDSLFPAASRMFLQTLVWPVMFSNGCISEVQLQLASQGKPLVPIFLNGRRGEWEGATACFWSLFAAKQSQGFETALMDARGRAEESQRLQARSERFTREVADLIPSMVAFWDVDLRCRFANQAHWEWLGKDPSSFVGRHFREALGHEVFATNEPHINAALSGQAQTFERTMTKASGDGCHALFHFTPQISNGAVAGFLVVVSDITALKNAEAALLQEAAERQSVLERLSLSSAALREAQRLGRALAAGHGCCRTTC